jgi:thiol-disulfide isomerase/thioredoxin
MKPENSRWWKTAATLLMIGVVMLACQLSGSGTGVNNAAPDFTLNTVGGRSIQLSEFKGRPVMINFWATWCGPCKAELPLMQDRFEAHYPNLVVLAIEEGSSIKDISRVMRETGVNFLVLRGTQEVLSRYGVRAFPTTYFIDAEGIIRSHHVGQLSSNQLDGALKKLGLE